VLATATGTDAPTFAAKTVAPAETGWVTAAAAGGAAVTAATPARVQASRANTTMLAIVEYPPDGFMLRPYATAYGAKVALAKRDYEEGNRPCQSSSGRLSTTT
jgi:hypothetical protein